MSTGESDIFSGVLLVSDYDDTLYGSNLHISPENRRAIRRFIAQGGLFTVATGRARKTFTPQVALEDIPLNAPAILSNGATIFDYAADRLVRRTYLPEQVLGDVEQVCRRFPQLGFEAYYQNEIYIHNPNIVTRRHLERVGMEGRILPI
ncbi:MAG: HAD hydrolase family protein, partial [Oscillospiraceae bacterium]|nr:HAD hydrolase family protein [Oscillospiraceae bacterium]